MNLIFEKRFRNGFNDIVDFCKNNRALIIIFFLSTFLFLYQHFEILSWDFSAYVINAKYLFYNGNYFEVLRPPLVPFLLGIFLIVGNIGEYFYIIFVSLLFLYSSVKLSDHLYDKYWHRYNFKKNEVRFLFFLLSCNPFLIYFGVLEGSELLALSFLELFLVFWLKNKFSAYYLGLAVLTRYNYLAFLPLVFINRDYKKVLKNLLLFVVIVSPWLIYNYLSWGNYFTSIVESYNHNILLRENIAWPFSFKDILYATNILIPFALLGLVYSIVNAFKRQEIKYTLIFLAIAIFTIFDYYNTPFKISRYLFNLSLPMAYFSMVFLLNFTKNIISKKKLFFIIFLFWLLITSFIVIWEYNNRFSDNMYKEAANVIIDKDLLNCSIRSNHWVPVNYYTSNTYSLWMSPQEAIANNEIVLIFKDYQNFSLDNTFIIDETNSFILFSRANLTNQNCNRKFVYGRPDTNSICGVISERFEKLKLKNVVEKVCFLFNKK